jgi:hypothetical protein
MKKLVVKPDAEPIFFSRNLPTKKSVRKKVEREKVCRQSQAAAK